MTTSLTLPRRTIVSAAILAALPIQAHAIDFLFTGGNYVPGVTAPEPLGASNVLNINAGANKFFGADTLTHNGTVNWNADTLFLSSTTINNTGLWNATSDNTLLYYTGSRPTFNNSGTFRKSAGAGSTTIGAVSFVNTGIVNAQTGTIDFSGGFATFQAGTQFTGAGVNAVTNNATFNGSFSSTNLSLRGGTFTGNAAVANGGVEFSGGTLAGSWEIATNQALVLKPGANKFLTNASLVNKGTTSWQGGTDTLYLSTSTIENQSLFDVQGNLTLLYYTGSRPTFTNTSTGRVEVAADKTLTVGAINFINNGGKLDAASGATINFQGGFATFNDGTRFTGAGVNAVTGNATFNGAFDSENLSLRGGTFTGNAAVANGGVEFSGGTLAGSWEIATDQAMVLKAGANKFLTGASLVNKGIMSWQGGTDTLYLSTSTIENQSLFDVQGNLTLSYYTGSRPTFTNTSTGRVEVAADKTLTVGGINFINNGGKLDAATGATINYQGGFATFNDGTRFTGAGVNAVTGNATFNGAFDSENLSLRGGTFTGNAAVANGGVEFSGGTLAGSWEIATDQAMVLKAGANKFLTNASLVNKGIMSWQGGDDTLYLSTSTIENQSLFDVQGNLTLSYYTGSRPTFTNTSTGRVEVVADKTLTVGGINFINNGGKLDAAAGATINYQGGFATFNDGTRFTGAGTNLVTGNARFVDGFTSSNLKLQSGVFTGGDGVTPGSEAVLNGEVVFSGGTIAGNWDIASGSTLNAIGGGNKLLTNATLTNHGTIAWKSADTLYMSSSTLNNEGKIDLQADAALTYYTGSRPALVNDGLLVKSGGTGLSDLSTLTVTNNGTIEVQTGTIRLPANFANAGIIMGDGTISTTTLINNGHVAPGSSIGTLTLAGNYTQTGSGFLDAELERLGSTDLFLVNGNATLAGTLALHCFARCDFAVGDEFVILDATGELSGSFASVTLDGFLTGAFNVVYDTAQDRVLLQVTERVTAAVPEADTWAMLVAGLAGLGLVARRRRPVQA